jgi:hypothetical protein
MHIKQIREAEKPLRALEMTMMFFKPNRKNLKSKYKIKGEYNKLISGVTFENKTF